MEKFIPYKKDILDALYEEPKEGLKTLSAEEFFKLPVNDEYAKRKPDSNIEYYTKQKDDKEETKEDIKSSER